MCEIVGSGVILEAYQQPNQQGADMEYQATNNEWTAQDEADWQAIQDDANEEYEQAVCNRYVSRDQANLY
jgi:hypothetical protein